MSLVFHGIKRLIGGADKPTAKEVVVVKPEEPVNTKEAAAIMRDLCRAGGRRLKKNVIDCETSAMAVDALVKCGYLRLEGEWLTMPNGSLLCGNCSNFVERKSQTEYSRCSKLGVDLPVSGSNFVKATNCDSFLPKKLVREVGN